MNLKYIRYNLEEAQEEIENIFNQLKKGDGYSHSEFYSNMQHLIHHVNIAWNSRESTWADAENASEDQMLEWGQYPKDIKLI